MEKWERKSLIKKKHLKVDKAIFLCFPDVTFHLVCHLSVEELYGAFS